MDFPVTTVTQNAQETQKLGENIAASILKGEGAGEHGPVILCLWGELASGKTTFTQGLARGLGVSARLLSPTFIIVRRYKLPEPLSFLYHLDLYRIHSEYDVETIGFSEMLQEPQSVVVIEWPERLGSLLPQSRLDLRLRTLENEKHEIVIQKVQAEYMV